MKSRPKPLTFRTDRAVKALKAGGCKAPNLCANFPYSCGCGFLVNSEYGTVESIERLGKGLTIGARRDEGKRR